jgi:putative hydrolase of the HAD superfamily
VIRAVLLDFGETLVERISDRDAPLTRLAPVLFPETDAVLGELERAGYLLGVVSNTERTDDEQMMCVLARLGIRNHFDTVVTSLSAGARKPDRAIFLRALEQLACSAAETAMVGDDVGADIAGGAALGMPTILVRRGEPQPPEAEADVVITSLFDLLPALDRLRSAEAAS